ncbi:MAG: hypothetical protein WCW36_00605, partial [Candidatus Paceibacterota bacterium]
MLDELTNLLPEERQESIIRGQRLRFMVVVASIVATFSFVASILLVPTYVFLVNSAQTKEERLADVTAKLSSAEDVALAARITTLSNYMQNLIEFSSYSSVSSVLRSVLATPRPGITISGFTYTAHTGKNPAILAISGSAQTREALRGYQLALQGAPFAISANLP